MSNNIKHSGIVKSIQEEYIQVGIVQTSACASCKISSQCNTSESKIKLVDVYGKNDKELQVGDTVTVVASQETGMRAVLIGFGVPFIILVLVLFGMFVVTGDESLSALVSLAALIPYYILIYSMRSKIRKEISFWIE